MPWKGSGARQAVPCPHMRRIPWTLWRAYTTELARLLTLTAGVLVTVIAFAGAVKPISDGLLQAGDTLTFIALAVPPMLAYALPFAGGFAATLVYHRIAGDLEAVAAYAGGVSHRALLAPALVVALTCTGGLIVLNEQVIPGFLREMQRLITVDVARLIAQQVSRGQTVSLKDIMIHADGVRSVPPEPGSGVIDQLLLTGVGAITLRDGVPTSEVTAARAKVWLLPASPDAEAPSREDEGQTMLVAQLEEVVAVREGEGMLTGAESRVARVVPNTFRDNVKFLTWRELAAIRQTPEKLNWVDPKRKALAVLLARKAALEWIAASLRDQGRVDLADDRGHAVTVRARDLRREGSVLVFVPPPGGSVLVSYVRVVTGADGRETLHRRVATGASVRLESDAAAELVERRVSVKLSIERARERDDTTGESLGPERAVIPVGRVAPPAGVLPDYLAMPARDLLAAAQPWLDRPTPDREVRERVAGAQGLEGALRRLDHDVMAKRHERTALAASCLVMVLCGAVTALKLASRMPLTVYLFSFFPALAAMVTISGGQQVTVKQGVPGLYLMWSGVVALAIYTLVIFVRLRRH